MHYIMNKDTVAIRIEDAKVINWDAVPLSLRLNQLDYAKISKWISYRALPLNRANSEKIYQVLNLHRDNSALELMYITHGLSINDNYWVANENELGRLKYGNINLFNNSLNEAMYLVALKGNTGFTIQDDTISAEYTGQGTYPKCFVREEDGIYLYKAGTLTDIKNEVYAAYIAKILGFNSVDYQYKKFNGVDCSVSRIVTNLHENWEDAFNMSEAMHDRFGGIPQEFAAEFFKEQYSNMIIFDALVLNDDRHMKNWAFSINADTNKIQGIATSYDYNKAFTATSKSYSNLIFDGYRKLNLLSAAKKAYRELKNTLNIEGLYYSIDNLNIDINKKALKNRLDYIVGYKNNQYDCY